MEKEFEKEIKQYMEKFKSAKNTEEALKILGEMRIYLTGVADSEADPFLKAIRYLYIYELRTAEALLAFVTSIDQKLTNLEKRVARIEDELELRKEYR